MTSSRTRKAFHSFIHSFIDPTQVRALLSIYLNNIAFLYEQGYIDDSSRLKRGWLGARVLTAALDSGLRFNNLELDVGGRRDADDSIAPREDLHGDTLFQEVGPCRILHGHLKSLERFHVHEGCHVATAIEELHLVLEHVGRLNFLIGFKGDVSHVSGEQILELQEAKCMTEL